MEMQARLLDAGEARSALQDCEGRVHVIALIHEKLYQVRDFAEVPFATYMRGLASDVFQAIGTSPSLVTLTLAVEDVAIAMDKAVPCGLILNELLTNSLKHAFPAGRRGTIRVRLSRTDGENLQLAVSDDGIGLPRGLRIEDAKSLGLRLITTLTRQLDGSLEIKSEGGASFKLTFPVKG
jgi:two-component sensor histidine kinase